VTQISTPPIPGERRGPWPGVFRFVALDSRFRGRTPRAGEAGFTLVEVMISLLIFGLLAGAAVGLLSFSVRAQTATAARLDDIAAFSRLTSSLSADLAQALPRRTRGEGGETQPAFFGAAGSGTAPMLRLVRGGWSNLDDAPRASVQKVDYIFLDGGIARVSYPMLDGAKALPSSPMLTHVRGVTFRYRYNGAWSDHWDGGSIAVMPQAMEMRLVRDNGSEFRALFLVGADQVNHATS
jgi:general secretion pathway protein J